MGVGFECDIPNPGDAMPIMVGKLPIILVRNKQHEIKAFHNVCRHRASMVLTKPEKGLTTLTCPYHAWAWDLDGKLKAIPYFDGTKNGQNTDLDWDKYGLVPVRCAVWHHWIFVNLDGNAPPIEEHVKPLHDLIGGADLSTTNVGKREDWGFDANWKLQNDNWETYHHIWVHKGIFNKISDDLDLKTGIPKMDTIQAENLVTLQSRSDVKRNNFRPGGDLLPLVPDTLGSVRRGSTSIIFPNVTVTLAPNYIASVITDPLAPGRTMAKLGFFCRRSRKLKESKSGTRKNPRPLAR
jgi:phenylpropionate dioxygenase-like ring-hydroxylating dioxygenase large terminal subunit